MDHWNKGGLSREEFLRMRENALRQLQELAKKQQAFANVDKAPAQNSNVMKNSSEKVLSARPEEKPQQTAPEKMQDAAVARPKEADLQTPPPILPDRPDRLDAGDFLHGSPKPVWQNERQPSAAGNTAAADCYAGRAGNRGKALRIYTRDPLPFAVRRIPSSAVALGT